MSVPFRLYVYALHGYLIEVSFTAAWELIASGDLKLPGCTSVWCLFIYSVATLVMEKITVHLEARNVPLYFRAIAHAAWMYVWEFCTGWVLKKFGACPWDYTNFTYNYAGLVTLEYAPLWYVCGILFECFLLPNMRRLCWLRKDVEGVLQEPLSLARNGYVVPGLAEK